MNIVFLNQHGANRGDHAAFISQIECVSKIHGRLKKITVVYNSTGVPYHTDSYSDIEFEHLKDFPPGLACKIFYRILCFFPGLIKWLPGVGYFSRLEECISNADYVYLANGGANLGPYRDWKYLARLVIARYLKAPLRSFGNSCNQSGSKIFDQLALNVIKSFDFYCARDQISQNYLQKNGIDNFKKSLDVVFVNASILLPSSIDFQVSGRYVVFVPNEVYAWHPHFRNATHLFNEYLGIINGLIGLGYSVVMIPQLFGDNHINDFKFFLNLKRNSCAQDKVIVCPESTGPSEQIAIIRGADVVIGGRYHSIVFSILANRPFVALSYEDKMAGMLEFLNLSRFCIDLNVINSGNVLSMVDSACRHENGSAIKEASDKAASVVRNALGIL